MVSLNEVKLYIQFIWTRRQIEIEKGAVEDSLIGQILGNISDKDFQNFFRHVSFFFIF